VRSRQLLLTLMLLALAPIHAFAQDCLHGADETPEQRARRVEALGAARHVNTLQANRPDRRGAYLDLAELDRLNAEQAAKRPSARSYTFVPDGEIVAGWQLTLARTDAGYWFLIKDKTDPCGFAYVSNQAGVIYRAEPIR
jgi:hypothetical protein